MQYTQQEKAQLKDAYAQRKRRQIVLSGPILVLCFGAMLARDGSAETLLGMPLEIGGPIFFGLTAAAVLFSWRNWRCPGCDTYLGRNFNPQYCPACGLELHG